MDGSYPQVGGASEAASISPAPAVDLLSALSVLASATDERHAALIALRDAAPADCTPEQVAGPLDRHFLDALICAHERAMDRARRRAQAVADEADRVARENAQLRHELRLVRGELDHLRAVAALKGAA